MAGLFNAQSVHSSCAPDKLKAKRSNVKVTRLTYPLVSKLDTNSEHPSAGNLDSAKIFSRTQQLICFSQVDCLDIEFQMLRDFTGSRDMCDW